MKKTEVEVIPGVIFGIDSAIVFVFSSVGSATQVPQPRGLCPKKQQKYPAFNNPSYNIETLYVGQSLPPGNDYSNY